MINLDLAPRAKMIGPMATNKNIFPFSPIR